MSFRSVFGGISQNLTPRSSTLGQFISPTQLTTPTGPGGFFGKIIQASAPGCRIPAKSDGSCPEGFRATIRGRTSTCRWVGY
jgi:hypothetical protein